MNLLPSEEKEVLKKGFKIRALILALFLVSAVFFAGFIMLLPSFFLAQANYSEITSSGYSPKMENTELAKVLNMPEEINSKLAFFRSDANGIPVSDFIYNVIGFLPSGVKLNSISFAKNQLYKEKTGTVISIFGKASDRDSLVSFSNSLKDSGQFSEINMPVSSFTKDRDIPFSMDIFIEDKK